MMAWVRLWFLVGVLAVGACAPQGTYRQQGNNVQEGYDAYQSDDYGTAYKKWIKAAREGDATAQYNLGVLYQGGSGVKRNYERAANWYRRAARQGHAASQRALENLTAFIEEEKRGENENWSRIVDEGFKAHQRKDYKTAHQKWFLAANQGDAVGQNNMGVLYANGQWVKQDYKVAARWYRLSARQGYVIAQNNLGNMYYSGWGVEKNYEEAARWFQMAADQGNEDAISNLELIYGERIESPPPLDTSPYELEATGTGFSVSSNGYILTNNHVVGGCAIVRVTSPLSVVKVVARDEENDLALLWHDSGESLSPVGWRDGSEVRLGEEIVIAGYPFQGILTPDLGVTTGTISALSGLGGDWRHLQITAPVQPGNSGGPLLDQTGRVSGIVLAELDEIVLASWTGDIPQNVNFAIRSSVARAFMDAHGVEYVVSSDDNALSTADIAEEARSYTVRIECWK